MKTDSHRCRRHFLKTSLFGGLAAAAAAHLPTVGHKPAATRAADEATPPAAKPATRVAVSHGNDRVDNAVKALRPFADEIARAIGDRRVVVKPNNVSIQIPLCATHGECIEGILEFLKSIGKVGQTVIAESSADGPTLDGFENYRYTALAKKYGVKLIDLDATPVDIVQVFDEKDFRPHAVRMAKLLLDPQTFVISAAKMKTHDRVVATLSLKNIIFGTAVKDLGFGWAKAAKPGTKSDKPIAHGSGFRGINYNLFALAQRLHPHLAVIDGHEGMEGNGPTRGTAVDHRVCVASPDWLAADRVAVELMGIDFAKIGYLNFCADARLGVADLKQIEVLGEPLEKHVKKYKLADSIDKQLIWMQPLAAARHADQSWHDCQYAV